MAGPEDYAARDRPHISISAFREAAQYSFPTRAQQRKPLREDYAAHAAGLLNQLNLALGSLPLPAADPRLNVDGLKPGTVVEVSTLPPGQRLARQGGEDSSELGVSRPRHCRSPH